MLSGRIHHVLIDLVGNEQHIGGGKDVLQTQHFLPAPDHAAGVVRRVDHEGAGFRGDGRCNPVHVGPEGARCEGHPHHHTPGQFDVRDIRVVTGLENNHLVAWVDDGQDGGQYGLGGARGHGQFGDRVVGPPVQSLDLGRHRLAQGGYACHRRILVEALAHGIANMGEQLRVAIKVRETLAQVHRPFFGGQSRHHGKDGGAHAGGFGGKDRAAGVHGGVWVRVRNRWRVRPVPGR